MPELIDASVIDIIQQRQNLASNPNNSVYVSASAGSGKTKILVDRYLRLLLNDVQQESILAITFTNAAAKEMLTRVIAKLEQWSKSSEPELKAELAKLNEPTNKVLKAQNLYFTFIEKLSKTNITTIHSFANNILSLHFSKEMKFWQVPPKKKLEFEITKQVTNYFADNQKLDFLLEYYDINQIAELISKVYFHKHELPYILSSNEEINDAVFSIDELLTSFTDINGSINYPELRDAISTKSITAIKGILLNKDSSPKKRFPKEYADELFTAQEALMNYLEKQNNIIIQNFTAALVTISKHIYLKMEEYKNTNLYLEFEDILLKFLELLNSNLNILKWLDYKIDHVMIDEAQDLSPLQWNILTKLTEEFYSGEGQKSVNRSVFIVGDYKQSIYSFQGAEPEIFKKIKNFYRDAVLAAGHVWEEIHLDFSFRSSKYILNFVDQVFNSNQLNNFLTDNKLLAHKHVRDLPSEIKVYELIDNEKTGKSESWQLPTITIEEQRSEILINQICTLVTSLINTGYAHEDIMIIFRKRGKIFYKLAIGLKKLGIKVNEDSKDDPLDSLIAKDLLVLAEHLAFPSDNYKLACLLKSPFFNFSEEELQDHILTQKPPISQDSTLHTLYYELLFKQGKIFNFIEKFGDKAYQTIKFFLSELQKSEFEYGDSSHLFINYLRNISDRTNKFSSQSGVNIITAHSAKGLEAQVVIIADSASSEQQPHENIYFAEGKFIFLPYAEFTTTTVKHIKNQQKTKAYIENLRLLYVVLTRAKRELHIFGIKNNKVTNSWYDLISNISPPVVFEVKPNSIANNYLTKKLLDFNLTSPIVSFTNRASKQITEKTRGVLIGEYTHKYLELLDNKAALSFLKKQMRFHLSNTEIEGIASRAENIAKKYDNLFNRDYIFNEYPISGEVDGKKISAVIDKLIFLESHCEVIDFKTDSDHANLNVYKNQLSIYKKLIELRFNKPCRIFLLWIATAELEEVLVF